MNEHAAVRAGDEQATIDLLVRLAFQAGRRFPPPPGYAWWSQDAARDLVADAFVRKGEFYVAAVIETTTDGELERYLLRVFENVLRDQARETELGKLIARLKNILGGEKDFVRHTSPQNSWRLTTSPEVAWAGDIGDLIVAGRRLRGIAVFRWNTSGPTPRETKTAIVRVSRAALTEADGMVRDAVVARVVQECVPAVPLDADGAERTGGADDVAADEAFDRGTIDEYNDGSDEPTAEEIALAVWSAFDDEERLALPHLDDGERAVAAVVGVGRRAGAAIIASIRERVRAATMPGQERAVVAVLHDLAASNARGRSDDAGGADGDADGEAEETG